MTDISAISSENNLTTSNSSSDKIDFSYSRFAKGVQPSNQDATMSFGDFMDMINPLEHIPVVSSVYRAVTGDTINPVSRIAGDALYGGAMGVASAGIAALGAIGDEVFSALNDGKSASATVLAMFSDDDATSPPTQMAATAATPDAQAPIQLGEQQLASLQTQARQSPILAIPTLTSTPLAEAATAPPVTDPSTTTTLSPAAAEAALAKAIPLDRSKLAYGGVMDTSMVQSAQQNQAVAMAMAGQNNLLQAQRNLRNNRFAPATLPLPGTDVTTNPGASSSASIKVPTAAEPQPTMQNLIGDLQNIKGINQYRNAAQSTPIPGNTLDIAN